MLLRPDAPLDSQARDGGTAALRDARIAARAPACHAERDGTAGDTLLGAPLVRYRDGLVTAYDTDPDVAEASAAAPFQGGAVLTARTSALGPTVVRIDDADTAAAGVPVATSPALLSTDLYGAPSGADDRFIGYVFVPHTERNEAGRPTLHSVVVPSLSTGDATADTVAHGAPTVEVYGNAECSYVDVYKTYTLDDQARPYIDRLGATGRRRTRRDANDVIARAAPPSAVEAFFLERVALEPTATGARRGTFTDRTTFVPPTSINESGAVTAEGFVTVSGTEYNEVVVPTDPYDGVPLAAAHAYHSTLDYDPLDLGAGGLEFSARAALAYQGRLLFGAPTWPTTKPQALFLTTDAAGVDLSLRFEYDAEGEPVLGPATAIADVERLVVPSFGAETALRVYVGAQLYERLVANATGAFVSQHQEERDGALTFSLAAYDAGRLRAETDGPSGGALPSADTVTEPAAVFASAVDRPREVTHEQFRVQQGNEVRLLAPARLSEDEGVRAYEFYVASDTGVWVARREGDAYVKDAVTTEWGVALAPGIRLDRGQAPSVSPIAAPTEAGLAVYGTDGHLHLLDGRRHGRLDAPTAGLWTEVLSLAFDPRPSTRTLPGCPNVGPLLWALVNDVATAPGADPSFGGTGRSMYAYAFGDAENPAGWVAHRTVPADVEGLFFDDPNLGGAGLLAVRQTGQTEVVNGLGPVRATAFWASGRVSDAEEVQAPPVRADYDGGTFTASPTATVRATILNDSVTPVGRPASGGQITREGAVAPGRPFFPRLFGRAFQVSVRGFEVLRGVSDAPQPR